MDASPRTDTAADVLCWQAHPARERLPAACLALLVMSAMAGLSAVLMQSLFWGAAALAVQIFALRRFFLPSRYRVDVEGVTASQLGLRRQYRWNEIRRFLYDARGGFLSTRRQASLLDLFRGMHLVFGEQRDAVIGRIRGALPEEAAG